MEGNSNLRRNDLIDTLGQELRWIGAYSVLFSHLLARRAGVHSTDLEAHDILTLSGPMPAGQLAALTGLTTGAVTTLIDRLERAALARREPDPGDRRKVIIRALPPPEALARQIMPEFERLSEQMDALMTTFNDKELAVILRFLEGSRSSLATRVAALGNPAPPATHIPEGGPIDHVRTDSHRAGS